MGTRLGGRSNSDSGSSSKTRQGTCSVMPGLTRGEFLGALASSAGASLYAQENSRTNQGMASRHVTAAARAKPSGLPFHSRFVDTAPSAGLTRPSICGYPDRADYVIDAMGCGVAFLDYDNDG